MTCSPLSAACCSSLRSHLIWAELRPPFHGAIQGSSGVNGCWLTNSCASAHASAVCRVHKTASSSQQATMQVECGVLMHAAAVFWVQRALDRNQAQAGLPGPSLSARSSQWCPGG